MARCERPWLAVSGRDRQSCLWGVRRAAERLVAVQPRGSPPLAVVVEALPVLAGVAEAAEVMGWDKRRVVTYMSRGSFPDPVQHLASGRLWVRSDVERYALEWRSKRTRRR